MSHDRGCFKCGDDPIDYASCTEPNCPKRPYVERKKKRSKRDFQARQGKRLVQEYQGYINRDDPIDTRAEALAEAISSILHFANSERRNAASVLGRALEIYGEDK